MHYPRKNNGMEKMIKVALKHFIYEKCIDVLFNSIVNNFAFSREKEFKAGDRFNQIKIILDDMNGIGDYIILYDCTILGSIPGTVGIKHSAIMEVDGDSSKFEEYGDRTSSWMIFIDEIKGYIRE